MKLGIALSGGGIRGIAHAGVLKALEDNGIWVDIIGGTSAGSLIAGLYAMGYSPEEMLRLFKYFAKDIIGANPKAFVGGKKQERGLHLDGLLSSYPIEAAFQEVAKYKNVKYMKDLPMKIAIPTTELLEEKEYVFTNSEKEEDYYIKDAEIGKAVRASSSFPGIYTTCFYQNHRFIDGGVCNNLPVQEVRNLGCDKVISVRFVRENNSKIRSAYAVAMRSLDIVFDNLMEYSVQNSDIALGVQCGNVNLLGISKIDYCYEQGYKETIQQMEQIKSILTK